MIKEIYGDLFDYKDEYYLVHCISADFALGAGIAVQFDKIYDMKNKLKTKHPNYKFNKSDCILIDNVFNLITKEKCYQKPTYSDLRYSLELLLNSCELMNINKLAMPLIGCGIDGLKWEFVFEMIKEIFLNSKIDILIVKWRK